MPIIPSTVLVPVSVSPRRTVSGSGSGSGSSYTGSSSRSRSSSNSLSRSRSGSRKSRYACAHPHTLSHKCTTPMHIQIFVIHNIEAIIKELVQEIRSPSFSAVAHATLTRAFHKILCSITQCNVDLTKPSSYVCFLSTNFTRCLEGSESPNIS